jgi:hypothetical protein
VLEIALVAPQRAIDKKDCAILIGRGYIPKYVAPTEEEKAIYSVN